MSLLKAIFQHYTELLKLLLHTTLAFLSCSSFFIRKFSDDHYNADALIFQVIIFSIFLFPLHRRVFSKYFSTECEWPFMCRCAVKKLLTYLMLIT